MVSEFYTAITGLRAFPHYPRQSGSWKKIGGSWGELQKSNKGTVFVKFRQGLGKPIRHIAISLRSAAAGLPPLNLWTKQGREKSYTEGLPDRTCGCYFGEGSIPALWQGASQ